MNIIDKREFFIFEMNHQHIIDNIKDRYTITRQLDSQLLLIVIINDQRRDLQLPLISEVKEHIWSIINQMNIDKIILRTIFFAFQFSSYHRPF